MTLKTKLVPIAEAGRDNGKLFFLTELPALQAEKWGWRVVLACGRAGVDIPDDTWQRGLAGVVVIGIMSLMRMSWFDFEPLLDDMMTCIEIIPEPKIPDVRRKIIASDIEEWATLLKLRAEVLSLHTDFSVAGVLSSLNAMMTPAQPSPNTKTSPQPSAQ